MEIIIKVNGKKDTAEQIEPDLALLIDFCERAWLLQREAGL